MKKVIIVTGSPGAGKSFLIKKLISKLSKLGYTAIELSASKKAFEKNLIVAYDVERDTHLIDYEALKNTLKKEVKTCINKSDNIIIIETTDPCILEEFVDLVVVVKCSPNVLRKRLEDRGWPKIKIEENIDSECMNIILNEAIECHGKDKVVAIDLTKISSVDKHVDFIIRLIRQ